LKDTAVEADGDPAAGCPGPGRLRDARGTGVPSRCRPAGIGPPQLPVKLPVCCLVPSAPRFEP
jgi:hypothetical protein